MRGQTTSLQPRQSRGVMLPTASCFQYSTPPNKTPNNHTDYENQNGMRKSKIQRFKSKNTVEKSNKASIYPFTTTFHRPNKPPTTNIEPLPPYSPLIRTQRNKPHAPPYNRKERKSSPPPHISNNQNQPNKTQTSPSEKNPPSIKNKLPFLPCPLPKNPLPVTYHPQTKLQTPIVKSSPPPPLNP